MWWLVVRWSRGRLCTAPMRASTRGTWPRHVDPNDSARGAGIPRRLPQGNRTQNHRRRLSHDLVHSTPRLLLAADILEVPAFLACPPPEVISDRRDHRGNGVLEYVPKRHSRFLVKLRLNR
jgi:hypothetical protein